MALGSALVAVCGTPGAFAACLTLGAAPCALLRKLLQTQVLMAQQSWPPSPEMWLQLDVSQAGEVGRKGHLTQHPSMGAPPYSLWSSYYLSVRCREALPEGCTNEWCECRRGPAVSSPVI